MSQVRKCCQMHVVDIATHICTRVCTIADMPILQRTAVAEATGMSTSAQAAGLAADNLICAGVTMYHGNGGAGCFLKRCLHAAITN